jgi:crossover junction endodeoxyribonuclease RuvC
MGVGVVERAGTRLVYVTAETIKAPEKASLDRRLLLMHQGLTRIIQATQPDAVAVEDLFFATHVTGALKLAQARGVALLAGAEAGLPVASYAPALVKRTVAGRGRSDKSQVARLVGAILGLTELPGEDATDALAVAITHAQAMRSGLPVVGARPKKKLSRR